MNINKVILSKETNFPLVLEFYIANEHELMCLYQRLNANSSHIPKANFLKEYEPKKVMDLPLVMAGLRTLCKKIGLK